MALQNNAKRKLATKAAVATDEARPEVTAAANEDNPCADIVVSIGEDRVSDWFRDRWLETDLPRGIMFSMAEIEETIDAADIVQEILAKDLELSEDHKENGVQYYGFNSRQRHGLFSAQTVLLRHVALTVAEIREGFTTKKVTP